MKIPFNKIPPINSHIIFMDIDGTLTYEDGSDAINEETVDKVKSLSENNYVFICSNNKDKARTKKIAESLQLKYLPMKYKKPNKLILSEIPEEIRSLPKTIIGDKWTTDGFLALNTKSSFIKVKRVKSGNESLFVKFCHTIDDVLSPILDLLFKNKVS